MQSRAESKGFLRESFAENAEKNFSRVLKEKDEGKGFIMLMQMGQTYSKIFNQ